MTARPIHISKSLSLPASAATFAINVIGKRGSGKTYTASVFIERLIKAGQPVVILDPLGVWWGLRSGADGKPDGGLPITILGGERADAPLAGSGGAVIAEMVARDRVSLVLDLSEMSEADKRRFVADFCTTLLLKNRQPVMVVLEEADAFAPESANRMRGEEEMLGAVQKMVRRGRSKGIGVCTITQRPALVSKNVLTQADVMVCLRLTAPEDRDAVDRWVKAHGSAEDRKAFMDSLASLETGVAWWWSPEALEIFERTKAGPRVTFDSTATPKPGAPVKPAKLRAVDLKAVTEKMGEAKAEFEANDPKSLKAEVARLKAELAKAPKPGPALSVKTGAATEADLLRFSRSRDAQWSAELKRRRDVWAESCRLFSKDVLAGLNGKFSDLMRQGEELFKNATPPTSPVNTLTEFPPLDVRPLRSAVAKPARSAAAPGENGEAPKLGKAARMILVALHQFGPMSADRAAAITGYAVKGGTFQNGVIELNTSGRIVKEGGELRMSETGAAAVLAMGPVDPIPTPGPELLRYWLAKTGNGALGKAAREAIQVLSEVYPDRLSPADIANGTPSKYEPTGGTFQNGLIELRTLGLAEGGSREGVRATPALMGAE